MIDLQDICVVTFLISAISAYLIKLDRNIRDRKVNAERVAWERERKQFRLGKTMLDVAFARQKADPTGHYRREIEKRNKQISSLNLENHELRKRLTEYEQQNVA